MLAEKNGVGGDGYGGAEKKGCGGDGYGGVVAADYSRYGVVLGKQSRYATLSCGIWEREWSVWRGAATAANLTIRYVSLQLPLYCDYLFVKE